MNSKEILDRWSTIEQLRLAEEYTTALESAQDLRRQFGESEAEGSPFLKLLDATIKDLDTDAYRVENDIEGKRSFEVAGTKEKETKVRLWYGSSRVQAFDRHGDVSTQLADGLGFGRLDVTIPKHLVNRLPEPGGLIAAFKRRRPDTRNFHPLDANPFWEEVREQLNTDQRAKEALMFIHGFNVKFEAAAKATGILAWKLGIGMPAFFAWPSRGSLFGYREDETVVAQETNIQALADFLSGFCRETDAERVHVIVHSMGNRLFLKALQTLDARGEVLKLGQVFLAAPDVDQDVFLDGSGAYAHHAERTTLYASNRDRAVWISKVIHEFENRAGYYPAPTVAKDHFDSLIFPNFDAGLLGLGHSYYRDAREMIQDMWLLIRNDRPEHPMDPLNRAPFFIKESDAGTQYRFPGS